MIEGAVLAVFVVFLFLRDWRATIISAVAIPLSAIPAFWFMDLMGFTLNGMTLLALSLVAGDRKSTRLNSSHANISYAVFCLKKKKKTLSILIDRKWRVHSRRHGNPTPAVRCHSSFQVRRYPVRPRPQERAAAGVEHKTATAC